MGIDDKGDLVTDVENGDSDVSVRGCGHVRPATHHGGHNQVTTLWLLYSNFASVPSSAV